MNRVLQVGAGTGRLEWKEIPRLDPGPQEVLVKVQYGAIKQGTEFSMARGYPSRRGTWNEELRIHEKVSGDGKEEGGESFFFAGNMVAGRVAAIGSEVTDFSAGERVFGFSSFAEHVLIPADRLWHLPKIDWRSALCLDPARFSLAAVRDSQVRLGDRVAVFGMGALGLLFVRMVLRSGAVQVVAVDPNREDSRWRAERIEAECLHLTGQGLIPGRHIIDRLVLYADLKEEYRMCMEDPTRAVKLGVIFPEGDSEGEGD